MIRQCAGCLARCLPDRAYRKASPEVRAGLSRMRGRGLCAACYEAARRNDTLIDHERDTLSREVLRDEWEHFADPSRSIRSECQRLATQFGMNWRSLERAISRAAIA